MQCKKKQSKLKHKKNNGKWGSYTKALLIFYKYLKFLFVFFCSRFQSKQKNPTHSSFTIGTNKSKVVSLE
jgi:hypothetical protein